MAGTGGWEVVGKQRVKKNNEKNALQTQKKLNNAPKLKDPIKESTIFDAFLKKEKSKNDGKVKSKGKDEKTKANVNQKEKQQQQNKSKQGKKQEKVKCTLKEALNQINGEELTSILASDQLRFPGNSIIWLKDLVGYLNVKISTKLTEKINSDAFLSGNPLDYPLNFVPQNIRKIITQLFEKCTDAALSLFFEYLVTNCLEDELKGLSTFGFRICIQSLAFYKPSITLSNLKAFADLRNTYQHQPAACLTILWALGQGGYRSFKNGLRVWFEMMLPYIGVNAYSEYAISYLQNLFKCHTKTPIAQTFDIREFFAVLDVTFSHTSNLPQHLHKKLLDLYAQLKVLAIGTKPEHSLRNFFPSLLIRLVSSASKPLKEELKSFLAKCLATDHQCYSIWRQLYTKHIANSSLLLEYLNSHWNELGPRLPKNLLKMTVSTFTVTNLELKTTNNTPASLIACDKHCQDLLARMSISTRIPLKLFFIFVLVILGIAVACDIGYHQNLQASTTGHVLRTTGLDIVFDNAWRKIEVYSKKGLEWSNQTYETYKPVFFDAYNTYVPIFWNYVYVIGDKIVEVTSDVRAYLNKSIPRYLEWLDENIPLVTQKLRQYVGFMWEYALLAVSFIAQQVRHAITWLTENLSSEKFTASNLQKLTSDAADKLYDYSLTIYQWINQQIMSLTSEK